MLYRRTEEHRGTALRVLLQRVVRFDGLNDSHVTPGTMIFCSMISIDNFSDCVTAPCEQHQENPVSLLQPAKHGHLQGSNYTAAAARR